MILRAFLSVMSHYSVFTLKAGFGTGVVYFKDPDGTNLELIAPKGPFQRERN